MALQELLLQTPEILERANSAVGSEFFTGVKIFLRQGQPGLAQENALAVCANAPVAPVFEGPPIGGLLGKLSPDSPITRCYEFFVALSAKYRA
jgi:hypothetical protein